MNILSLKESELQRDILKYLKSRHILAFRVPLGPVIHGGKRKKNPLKGWPDIIGFFPRTNGEAFGIEVKTKTKLSDAQKEMREVLEIVGVVYILAHSLQDVMDYF